MLLFNSKFNQILRKTLPTKDFELTVPRPMIDSAKIILRKLSRVKKLTQDGT